jgi:pimeloyl-ACP methyl ester carboxylesterase
MESATAKALANRKPNDNKMSFHIVEDAGHQIIFDNPQKMASYILQENNST